MAADLKTFDPFRQPLPADEDAERFAIGAVMQHESLLRSAMAVITPSHFSVEKHRVIWECIKTLHDAESPVNFQLVLSELSKVSGRIDQAGGPGYVVEFTETVPAASMDIWAMPILETYARRRLMMKCNESMIRLANKNDPYIDICQELEEESRACAVIGQVSSGFVTFEDVVRECGGLDAFLSRGVSSAVSYPWPSLTQMTNGGMRPGQVIVIAGPSGQGKTALALNIAYHAAKSSEGYPAIFSLEMQKEEIKTRLLAIASRVDSYHFRRLDDAERERIRSGVNSLINDLVFTDDDDCGTVAAMRSKLKKKMAVQPISMVLIDYVQLIEGVRSVGENREQEIAKIMRGIKRMAMKLKLPFVVLSQVNQDSTGNREPELKDLRESRSIGHNADLVAFLNFTRPYDIAAGIPTGDLDLIVRKQRSGPEGRINLRFHAPTGRFYELDSTAKE